MQNDTPNTFQSKLAVPLLVTLIFVVGLVLLLKKDKTPDEVVPTEETPVAVETNWPTRIAQIRTALQTTFVPEDLETRSKLTIAQEVDLTGDGAAEAFIDTGSGGASSTIVALVRIKNNQVLTAQVKQEDGTIAPALLVEGSSARHAEQVGINAVERSFYQAVVEYSGEEGALESCEVTAYQWNAETEVFDYSSTISGEVQKTFCASLAPNL